MHEIPYIYQALISVIVFAVVHFWTEKTANLNISFHRKLISFGAGVASSYVFLDLLPKLSLSDETLKNSFSAFFPFLEKHVYIMALAGFCFFFSVDRSKAIIKNESIYFWLSLTSYTLLNFLIGYAVVDQNNPEVQPLLLFTFAMALHLFMNDYSLTLEHGKPYQDFGRWILIASLFIGWGVGAIAEISATAIALVSGFIGGGVIMNVIRHELPPKNEGSLKLFLMAAFVYSFIIL
jgi:hypothetical protein